MNNSNYVSSSLLILLIMSSTLMIIAWHTRHNKHYTNHIIAEKTIDVMKNDKYEETLSTPVIHKPSMPTLALEGILISDKQNPKALLKVNNNTSKWHHQGEEIYTGLKITKIDSNSIMLKQDMAYYEILLINYNENNVIEMSNESHYEQIMPARNPGFLDLD